jgi:hypothetical protein
MARRQPAVVRDHHRPAAAEGPAGGALVERKRVPEPAGRAVLGGLDVPAVLGVDQRDAAGRRAGQAAAVLQQAAQDRGEPQITVDIGDRVIEPEHRHEENLRAAAGRINAARAD